MEKTDEKHNKKAKKEMKKYEDLILDILLLMLNFSFLLEEAITKYNLHELLNSTTTKDMEILSYLLNRVILCQR